MIYKKKLDFIIVGAAKAGTTSLWVLFSEAEEIWMPPKKELNAFDKRNYDEIVNKYIKDAPPGKLLGECTPYYMSNLSALKNIFKYNKDIKLIYILRDPIARAWSQFNFEKTMGFRKKNQSIEEAYNLKMDRHYHLVFEHGYYQKWIKIAETIFESKNIFITSIEILNCDFYKEKKHLEEFLGVNLSFADHLPTENITSFPTNKVTVCIRKVYLSIRPILMWFLNFLVSSLTP